MMLANVKAPHCVHVLHVQYYAQMDTQKMLSACGHVQMGFKTKMNLKGRLHHHTACQPHGTG